jgi:hypothetical protein
VLVPLGRRRESPRQVVEVVVVERVSMSGDVDVEPLEHRERVASQDPVERVPAAGSELVRA